jgi:hypothetical protein
MTDNDPDLQTPSFVREDRIDAIHGNLPPGPKWHHRRKKPRARPGKESIAR